MLELTGRILEGTCEPLRHLTLAICIPKGERFDWLIEKSVEVGVSQLIPLQTERSVVQPRAAKLDRQRRAVIEASKQCGRNRLMSIASPRSWAELIAHEAAPLRAVGRRDGNPCSEISECRSLEPAILAIGPEGGLTEAELELAFANGWRSLTLARTVLRVETAAIVGSALILNASQS